MNTPRTPAPIRAVRRAAPAAALVLLAAGLVVAGSSGPATAQAAMCDGQEATLVGTPGKALNGTAGADVIVTNGATDVDARAGDDLVCITGTVRYDRTFVDVIDGAGDDVVRNQAVYEGRYTGNSNSPVSVVLAAGNDTFVGAAGEDFVRAFSGTDDIDTAGGRRDTVVAGPSDQGADGPFDGRVSLGADGGDITVGSRVQPDTVLDGGEQGSLTLYSPLFEEETDFPADQVWDLDAAAGVARVGGQARFTFTGMSRFDWSDRRVGSFVGTDADETLLTRRLGDATFGAGDDYLDTRLIGEADLGEGDDDLALRNAQAGSGSVEAGPGDDHLLALAGSLEADLSTGRLTVGDAPTPMSFAAFETYLIFADEVELIGTPGPDTVEVIACTVDARAGAGDDRIVVTDQEDGLACSGRGSATINGGAGDDVLDNKIYRVRATTSGGPGNDRITGVGNINGGPDDDRLNGRGVFLRGDVDRISGGPGDDVMTGYAGDDVLLGRAGTDQAFGGRGRDTCRAESKQACER